ncbi:unnamed protein product [Laminaria digitata]
MVRKGGDVGRWLHQDLGFDDDDSAVFGASLRARHLHNPKAIFAMDQQTLEAVLRRMEMPELLASLVTEAWRRRRKEDEDRRHAETETALVEARQRAESAAEERRRREEKEITKKKRAEQERAEQERAEQERAEEHARLERQRVKELERQEMVRKAGDVGRWLHQDLGFDDDNSAVFGASLRTRHLHNPKAIFAVDQRTLEAVLRDVEMPELLASLVMEAWQRRRKEDEDRRRAQSEAALIEARQRAESAAEERRRREEEELTKKQLREAEAEAERQRLEVAAREQRALRQQQALHTQVWRWLKMEAHFDDTQASRYCAELKEQGLSSTQALKVQDEAEQQQLALELKMNKYEARMFIQAMKTLRSKPDVFDVPSSTANAGASFVNLMQLRDCGGMATVFTANQLMGGPESTATRRVVLKRSDKDQPAAYLRESRVLQYLSRPGGAVAGFVVQLLEAYTTPEYNFIAMEQGGQNLTVRVEESKRLPSSERKTHLALWGQQACQVLVALHGLGVVWGDVKPDNFVFRGDRLVAVDFGSTCVEVGSTAQRELGTDADTSFTSSPSDQFAWSVQYAAPERARNDRLGSPCVARCSQDVWSLGMVLYYLSTGGAPFFPSPVERTEVAIAQFREHSQHTLTKDNFCVDLRNVRGSAWRCSLGLALERSVDERGTASEVLEAFTRGIQGLVSTVSKTRGMESLKRMLAVISEDQQEVLRRTGTISGDVGRVLQEQLNLRRRVTAMSTVLEHLAMDEMRMPHTFLVLPEKQAKLRRPKQWFADRGRLHFVCAHGLELAPCGKDGAGFLVSQPKEWMKKHATLLQVTVMAILAAAAVAGTAASGGAIGPIAASLALPFEVIDLDEAYRFLSGVGGEEMDRMLEDISDTLDPTKGEVGVCTNLQRVKEVTGAEYRSVLSFLDTRCEGWDRQMGGMERTLSADGVMGWVCPQHRSEWKSSEVQDASATARQASGNALSPNRRMPAEPAAASGCNCTIS